MSAPEPGSADYESLCRRCGVSCHFAIPVNGLAVVIDDLHCRFLEQTPDGRFGCSVYPERFERAPWCATAEEALADGLLAQSCLYTQWTPGYRGKARLSERLMKLVLPAIRAEVLEHGVPVGVSEAGLRRFLERTGGPDDPDWHFQEDAPGVRLTIVPVPDPEGDR